MPQNDPSGISELKLQDKWSNPVFHEIAAIAIAKNAVVVTGLSRNRKEPEKIKAGVCAISLADGKVLWHEPLPAVPTAWGLAVGDSGNRIVVTLMDGRVLGFTK
jgi:hypothetical protein